MSKEREPKRRSPSVIARLMGLEGLPSQQPAYKLRRKSQQNSQGTTYENHSMRKSLKEQQEFKDVFEVLDTKKVENNSCPPRRTGNSELSGADLAFFRQKFMDAKRLSTDEKLQNSKEFSDALEVLDSNKDLFLKLLQEPDPLFLKHLHDLRRTPHQSQCSHTAARKSEDSSRRVSKCISSKSHREFPCKNYSSPPNNRDNMHMRTYTTGTHHDHNIAKFWSGGKNEASVLPTSIVILKPNLERVRNVATPVSSPHSSHAYMPDCDRQRSVGNVRSRKVERCGKNSFYDDEEFSRHKSRESREIAKRITRRMRGSVSTGSLDFSPYGFKGYAGDESSCYTSGNDSANESDTTLTYRKSFDSSNKQRPLSYHSPSSSVNKEAKKRLSERWKMTHKFQEVGLGRSSTLGEMLAIPDREVRTENLDTIIVEASNRDNRFARNGGWVSPSGISSKDGWKDECIRKLSRSRSLPASSGSFGSPGTSMRHITLGDDRYLMQKDTLKKRKGVKGKLCQGQGSLDRSLSSSKNSCVSRSVPRENFDAIYEVHVPQNQPKSNHEDECSYEKKIIILGTPVCNVKNANSLPHAVVDSQDEILAMPSASPDKLLPRLSASMLNSDSPSPGFNTPNLQDTCGQSEEDSVPLSHPPVEPESPASSKEAEQPSPVSVLEVPFMDDVSSSSECFGSLSADLQGLRMQLQLLKLESGGYAEGCGNITSQEETGEESPKVSNERRISVAEECPESFYVIDVLVHSGLCDGDADLDMVMARCHSPECPVDPQLFERLENKYGEETNGLSTYERKLLFDRVNSELAEIFLQFTNPHPWVKPVDRLVICKRSIDGLEKDLSERLTGLGNQGKTSSVGTETTEVVLKDESKWLDLEDEFDGIGRDIESLLMEELVAELEYY